MKFKNIKFGAGKFWKITSEIWMVITILLFYFGIMSFWIINDIVGIQSILIKNCNSNITYGVTNGFYQLNYIQSFHFALYLGLGCLVFLVLIIVHILFNAQVEKLQN